MFIHVFKEWSQIFRFHWEIKFHESRVNLLSIYLYLTMKISLKSYSFFLNLLCQLSCYICHMTRCNVLENIYTVQQLSSALSQAYELGVRIYLVYMSSSSPPQPKNLLENPLTCSMCSLDMAATPPNIPMYGSLHRNIL